MEELFENCPKFGGISRCYYSKDKGGNDENEYYVESSNGRVVAQKIKDYKTALEKANKIFK